MMRLGRGASLLVAFYLLTSPKLLQSPRRRPGGCSENHAGDQARAQAAGSRITRYP